MVIKGEYLTHVSDAWKKNGYVFEDYRPGQIVYHYTNLVIGTNLQLQTMPNKNSSKSRYLLPYFEHDRIKDSVFIRGDPDGLVKWPQVGSQVCGSQIFWFHGLIDYLQADRFSAW